MKTQIFSILNLSFILSLLINYSYSNYNERFKRIPDTSLDFPFNNYKADRSELEQSMILKKLAMTTPQFDKDLTDNSQENDQRDTRSYSGCLTHRFCASHQYCGIDNHCHATCQNRRRRGGTVYAPHEKMNEEDYQFHRSRRCSVRDRSTNGWCSDHDDCGCNRHCSCYHNCAYLPNR